MDLQVTIQLPDEQIAAIAALLSKSNAQLQPVALTPQRCAECDCVHGGAECNWIAPPSTKPWPALIRAMVYERLRKYHHIVPVGELVTSITQDIVRWMSTPDVVPDNVSVDGEIIGYEEPRKASDHIPVHAGRAYHRRVRVKGQSVCQAIAAHYQNPINNMRFDRTDVAKWLRDSGHNPDSAVPALGYLEGAGVVVAVERVRAKKGRSWIVYTWGRRLMPDEDVRCWGPTGLQARRNPKLPVRRVK